MRIASSDYFLARFSYLCRKFLRRIGDWETSLVESRLNAIEVVRPVFICGLARSGSTILLELLSRVESVATHRYRDFPFQSIPWIWNSYLNKFQSETVPVERPHGDRIQITRESPESMEEPLWMMHFPNLHSTETSQALTGDVESHEFSKFYNAHLRKILLIRRGNRYVAKNNYNVGRIPYLLKLFPDAHFIVPIRHPVAHTHSLVSQHTRFCEYARVQSRVSQYLQAAGHFEFGPQRIPIQFDETTACRTLEHWRSGEDHLGYAVQWNAVYGFLHCLRESDQRLSDRIHLVRYEDFCNTPEQEFNSLIRLTGLPENNCVSLDHVCAAEPITSLSTVIRDSIWRKVEKVAVKFGYIESR